MRSYVAAKSTIAADLRVPETCRHIITLDTYRRQISIPKRFGKGH